MSALMRFLRSKLGTDSTSGGGTSIPGVPTDVLTDDLGNPLTDDAGVYLTWR